MYYPCSENKDADQLRGYREADLRLCFHPCKLLVFSRTGSYIFNEILFSVIKYSCANDVLQQVALHLYFLWIHT